MTSEEYEFKADVIILHERGQFPSPTKINEFQKRVREKMQNINGRQCRWRVQVFKRLGYEKDKRTGRWRCPR